MAERRPPSSSTTPIPQPTRLAIVCEALVLLLEQLLPAGLRQNKVVLKALGTLQQESQDMEDPQRWSRLESRLEALEKQNARK